MYENKTGISISDIINRLKISRNYITRNITHCVKHIEKEPSKGAKVIFDARELREYLKNQATFSRQTKRINLYCEMEKYNKQFPEQKVDEKNLEKFIGNVPKMSEITRGKLPFIPLKPFDFWDFHLIFPKEYLKGDINSKIHNSEICYRDMFDIGAIKIQLGKQKTMFCILDEPDVPHYNLNDLRIRNYDAKYYYLVPADWQPFYKGIQTVNAELKKLTPFTITVKGDCEKLNWHDIESALRSTFTIDKITGYKVEEDNCFVVTIAARLQK